MWLCLGRSALPIFSPPPRGCPTRAFFSTPAPRHLRTPTPLTMLRLAFSFAFGMALRPYAGTIAGAAGEWLDESGAEQKAWATEVVAGWVAAAAARADEEAAAAAKAVKDLRAAALQGSIQVAQASSKVASARSDACVAGRKAARAHAACRAAGCRADKARGAYQAAVAAREAVLAKVTSPDQIAAGVAAAAAARQRAAATKALAGRAAEAAARSKQRAAATVRQRPPPYRPVGA